MCRELGHGRKTMKTTKALTLVLFLIVDLSAHGQNTIRFNDVKVTEERAIRLSWASNSNEVYQVQCADALATNDDGSTTWSVLYDHYPSHGTNTFWLDTGNYGADTIIPHPKYSPMRFYRVFNEGTNCGESPFVVVTSPTNGSILSGQVTVSVTATSSYPIVSIKLFVDGQAMNPTLDGTNFVINTCEWPNGAHILFATARALSGNPELSGSLGVVQGQSVSSYVPVSFSNLITKVAFSQWFFEPSLGQTQEVTASFGAPAGWTLQIVDESSNAVRTVTGSGTSLVFDWDGTGDGGTNIPDGVYHYQISAETNGNEFSMALSGGSSLEPSLGTVGDPETVWTLQGNGDAVPLAIYPFGIDTNGMTLFEATRSEAQDVVAPSISSAFSVGGGAASADFSGPSEQETIAPTRPPTASNKNTVNTYGIAYWDYGDFPNGRTLGIPGNGQPIPQHVHLNGSPDGSISYDPALESGESVAWYLRSVFLPNAWKQSFEKADKDLSSQRIRRNDQSYFGGELFTSVALGVFISHGSYGTDPDYSPGASGARQAYFPSGNPSDNGVNKFDTGWLRMCQFGFGGNLKWMNIGACNIFDDAIFDSMSSVGGIPLKTTHLICGESSSIFISGDLYYNWAANMIVKKESISQAWFDAGVTTYKDFPPTNSTTMTFRVVGYPECLLDTIATNTAPSSPSAAPRNLTEVHQQVFPFP
jgi:hypothetical protein